MAVKELELTPFDLSLNWFALAYCILTNYNPEKVLDRALMKFELSGTIQPDTGRPGELEDPATAILSIVKRHKS